MGWGLRIKNFNIAVKPVYSDHLEDKVFVVVLDRWSL